MSCDEVRRYANRTARELIRAGVPPESLTGSVDYEEPVTRQTGRIFKRTVTEVQRRHRPVELLKGWLLWSHTMSITEYHGPAVHEGWSEERAIWLSVDGELCAATGRVGQWQSSSRPNQPDQWSVGPASDSDITMADWNMRPAWPPKLPRVPNGLYESHAKWAGAALPEGRRISMRLTDLRKRHGTYVKRQPTAGRRSDPAAGGRRHHGS